MPIVVEPDATEGEIREVIVVPPDPMESEIREVIRRIATADNASNESRWAYQIGLAFIGIGRQIQGLQREYANRPDAGEMLRRLVGTLDRCQFLAMGGDLEDRSRRQEYVIGAIANTPIPPSCHEASADEVSQVLYAVTDMRFGIFSGMPKYDEIFGSQQDVDAAARAVLAFHGKYAERGKSKWDIINDFLERQELGCVSTPTAKRGPGYKHPLMKVWQKYRRKREEQEPLWNEFHRGNTDSTVE